MWFGHHRRRKKIDTFWRRFLVVWLVFGCVQTTSSLTCLTCMFTSSTTQLDNFRISTRLHRPQCLLEPIKCDRDQDVCVTITMHSGNGDYWMGAGCDKRKNFHHMACQNVRSMTQNTQPGQVQQRHSMQRVCVCPRDLCNSSTFPKSFQILSKIALFSIFILLFSYIFF
ncbi:unnamed protein product [Caenorhabditis angaria]|uniref:Uncharacterized protein n=1 Tax=Caenorhabditis angaria TaxID=860376 RepID=A0A9P1N374_9PELO|nr:unnamed protein product [Caenorhabditis angaria]